MSYEWLFFCVLSISQIPAVLCQFEICIFHGLDADCRYKIDARTISHMTAKIDQCDHPISLAFNIHNDVLGIDFSHTFDGPDTLIMVHGFDVETKLRVRLNRKDDDILNVEVDFYVYGLADADFINQDIELIGLTEGCFTLNEAGKIAVGVTGGLVFIVIVMVIILLFIRRSRRKQEAQRYQNGGFAGGGTMEMNSRAPEINPSSLHSTGSNGRAFQRRTSGDGNRLRAYGSARRVCDPVSETGSYDTHVHSGDRNNASSIAETENNGRAFNSPTSGDGNRLSASVSARSVCDPVAETKCYDFVSQSYRRWQ